MASLSQQKFARLLTEGVYQISLRESKPIQIVQDELGHTLGRANGSAVEYWRKGHIPNNPAEIAQLAREFSQRGHVERGWLEQFLWSAAYPHSIDLLAELFPYAPDRAEPVTLKQAVGSNPASSGEGDTPHLPAPFIIGPPITHPRNFFGREYEIKRIFELWKRHPLQNVAVIGLKRSGKTSLLHYLKNITSISPEQARFKQRTDWLPYPERYRWVLTDFQDARMHSQERLLRHWLMGLQLPVPESCDLHGFMDIVSQQLQAPAIILMDEIGAALNVSELSDAFWSSLRSLVSHQSGGNLGFLITSHEPLAQLVRSFGRSSPFFNIFGHTFALGPLTEVEARELIGSSPKPFEREDTEWILAHSGRWPCLLQILCHVRLAALDDGETDTAWRERGLQQLSPFEYLLTGKM